MIKELFLSSLLAIKLASPGDFIDEVQDQLSIVLDQTSTWRDAEFTKDLFLNDEEPEEILIAEDEEPMLLTSNSAAETKYKNVVIYDGTFNGNSARLVVPYSGYNSLSVIDNVIVNIGNSTVTGRLLYGDAEIDPNEYDTYSYVINPVYGSPSNVYRYGSYNYERHYYHNGTGISYTDTYGKFTVTNTHLYYSDSQRTYYGLLVIIFILGLLGFKKK